MRDRVLLPKVRAAPMETRPDHYDTLGVIAAKHGLTYSGSLKRSNYSVICAVAEKFGDAAA